MCGTHVFVSVKYVGLMSLRKNQVAPERSGSPSAISARSSRTRQQQQCVDSIDEEASSMKQRRRHSVEMWTNTLSGASNIELRYIVVGKVHALGRRKLKVYSAAVIIGSVSLRASHFSNTFTACNA